MPCCDCLMTIPSLMTKAFYSVEQTTAQIHNGHLLFEGVKCEASLAWRVKLNSLMRKYHQVEYHQRYQAHESLATAQRRALYPFFIKTALYSTDQCSLSVSLSNQSLSSYANCLLLVLPMKTTTKKLTKFTDSVAV